MKNHSSLMLKRRMSTFTYIVVFMNFDVIFLNLSIEKQFQDLNDESPIKEIDPSNIYQKNFMKLTTIALLILGITAMVILIFLLLIDARWEPPCQSNFSTVTCLYKRNQTIHNGPVIRPAPTGLG